MPPHPRLPMSAFGRQNVRTCHIFAAHHIVSIHPSVAISMHINTAEVHSSMKYHFSTILITAALAGSLAGTATAQPRRGRRAPGPPPAPKGVVANVSGSISQYNYNRDGDVEGFLLGNNTIVHLPPQAAIRSAASFHIGDSIDVSGFGQTSASGLQTIEAQSIKDRTSGKTLAMPEPGPAAPFSGSGRIQQLNYGPDGAVNGFLLHDGTLATMPPFSAGNPSSIRVGSTVAYSGYARRTMSDRTVVDVQNLTINGQQLALGLAGPGAGPAVGPAGPPPPPDSPRSARAPLPAGRADQPPPPPPPAQAPLEQAR